MEEKCGRPPGFVRAYPAGGMRAIDVYAESHALLQHGETLENLPRVGLEAMAAGVLVIADNAGGWRDQVEHGRSDGRQGHALREQRFGRCVRPRLDDQPTQPGDGGTAEQFRRLAAADHQQGEQTRTNQKPDCAEDTG